MGTLRVHWQRSGNVVRTLSGNVPWGTIREWLPERSNVLPKLKLLLPLTTNTYIFQDIGVNITPTSMRKLLSVSLQIIGFGLWKRLGILYCLDDRHHHHTLSNSKM